MNKNDISKIEQELKNNKLMVAMIAPSFVSEFNYPSIISQLKKLGFDKVTEITFGAKMINREYHKQIENSKKLLISSTCPGISEYIKKEYPQYKSNLIKVDSPMIATAKICKKIYPGHKTIFISPCNYKKLEAENSKFVDYIIDYQQLKGLFKKYKIKENKNNEIRFDRFYNDYTKVYPLSGGLSKTAHLKGIIKKEECGIVDGIKNVKKFLDNPNKKIRFLDITFCYGGCIGGPCLSNDLTIKQKKKKVLDYMKLTDKEPIPENRVGIIKKAKGIKFSY
ncbi:MAG: [Fe-Fe] hydrogenase large subunit C-terminal domain-containing protein [Candidatus Pacearchaeota archaeon]